MFFMMWKCREPRPAKIWWFLICRLFLSFIRIADIFLKIIIIIITIIIIVVVVAAVVIIKIIIIIIKIIIIIPMRPVNWVDVEWGIGSSHGEKDPL